MPPGLLLWLAEDLDCFHIARSVRQNMLLIIKIVCLNKKSWIFKRNIICVFIQPDIKTQAFKNLPLRTIIPF